jgi:lipopolysaccharide/colanic/teichoic acid biosynthesis glycosyltransferase
LRLKLKRAMDLAVAGVGLMAGAPVLAFAALGVRAALGAPVLFRQERAGRGGRPFTLLKLRTMTDARGADGAPLPDAQRLTPFGRFLRSTSLDELPQLWNVLRGDLSLVGPRPLHTRYLPRYSPAQRRRHDVLPGLTGWAQVHGRNRIGWEERLALDVWYVDHWSLVLDAKVLAMTAWQVLRRDGVTPDGEPTMPEFLGGKGR